ncbi:transcriptional regulator with XRE-family HTH domain [Sporomusaceae bacterium BoRhaA]|uniref:helix-turn-helix domain-containing protein n=1 Tax=Pelorhabdus rhamnosifermentans TaxID=2772457 RepID=UPI001C061B0F|nr:helix-turn-helix transcriptional regulator [Pelorhabdus rhamnosifermentans]MBU2703653.1 transcriptional regulator with XRE-family HTH domain [Pelorhabdus rhamnosifermentans]
MSKLENITLQKMLNRAGIKQKEMAQLLNISESGLSLKLSGKREMSIEEAGIIADKLQTTADQIRHALNFAKCKVELSSYPTDMRQTG